MLSFWSELDQTIHFYRQAHDVIIDVTLASKPDPFKELYKRREKLRAVIDGSVPKFLNNYIKSDLTTMVSDHQSQRINKALKQDIVIYPEARGVYVAHSKDSDSSYVLSLEPASCTCSDFMYNCDYKSGESCKHIWKLRAMISIGALPPQDSLPNLWTLARIQTDLHHIDKSEEDLSELRNRLVNLQKNLASTDWYNVEYKEIYEEWYEMLQETDLDRGKFSQ